MRLNLYDTLVYLPDMVTTKLQSLVAFNKTALPRIEKYLVQTPLS